MLAGRFYEVLKKMPSSRSGAAGHEPMELEVTGGLMADYEKRKRAMDQKKGLGQQQSSEYDDRKKCSGCKKPLEGTALTSYDNASLAFHQTYFHERLFWPTNCFSPLSPSIRFYQFYYAPS